MVLRALAESVNFVVEAALDLMAAVVELAGMIRDAAARESFR